MKLNLSLLATALSTALVLPALSWAAPLSLGVEPIIGYERVQKFVPTPHTKDRLIYGARLTAGIPLLAAEAQYTRGTDTESFPTEDLSTKDTDDKLKVGLRSQFRMSSLLSLAARGGVQGKKNIHEETRAGVTTRDESKVQYDPYAGLTLGIRLASALELNGGVTVVFNDFPRMNKNDYESTLGMKIRFP